jgi:hypothetical protein
MALFDTVDLTFRRRCSSQQLAAAFHEWRKAHEGLGCFVDLDDLVAWCRKPRTCSQDVIDSALTALCIQAAGGAGEESDDDAACLLLWILLEPLTRRSEDPDIGTPLDADDAQAEIAAGMWEQVVRVRPGTTKVASVLVNGGRRRARLAARAEIDYRICCRRLFELHRSPQHGNHLGHPESVVRAARETGVLSGFEAELIAATRLGDDSLSGAATNRDLTYSAARKRRGRAETRLLAWMRGSDVPTRFAAGARAGVVSSRPQGVSDLREQAPPQSGRAQGKEVMPGCSDGLPNHTARRSDAIKPSGAPDRAHGDA